MDTELKDLDLYGILGIQQLATENEVSLRVLVNDRLILIIVYHMSFNRLKRRTGKRL